MESSITGVRGLERLLSFKTDGELFSSKLPLRQKCRLGKAPEFHRLLDEMLGHGIFPDFHTFNILLHVYGKTDNPLGALECYEGGMY